MINRIIGYDAAAMQDDDMGANTLDCLQFGSLDRAGENSSADVAVVVRCSVPRHEHEIVPRAVRRADLVLAELGDEIRRDLDRSS